MTWGVHGTTMAPADIGNLTMGGAAGAVFSLSVTGRPVALSMIAGPHQTARQKRLF